MNAILIIAHTPLASALRACVLHVFPDCENDVLALDVHADIAPQETLTQAQALLQQFPAEKNILLFSDVFGATPCNVAQKMVDDARCKLICGVNLPMLLRTVSYRHESLEALISRAMVGGTQGIMQVASSRLQNQAKPPSHDQKHHHDQQ